MASASSQACSFLYAKLIHITLTRLAQGISEMEIDVSGGVMLVHILTINICLFTFVIAYIDSLNISWLSCWPSWEQGNVLNMYRLQKVLHKNQF